jgi:hypothetical protein
MRRFKGIMGERMKTQTLVIRKIDISKVALMASTVSALSVAPLLTANAQAAPPSHAPAHGYYKNKDKNKVKNKDWKDRDRDGYDDRDRDRDGDLDERDNYNFQDRNNNGIDDRRERGYIDRDRDGVDDRYDSDYTNGGANNDRNRVLTTFTGTVVRDMRGNRFELRASNGVVYRVVTNNSEPVRLTAGDQVEVRGYTQFNNRVIVARRVVITRDDDTNQTGSRVNFPGTVTDVRSDRELTVRGENGRNYTVRSNNLLSSRISRGDRVRVMGRVSNGVVIANNVVLTRDDNNNNGNTVRFEGRVQSVSQLSGRRFLTVRANNGTTYRVQTPDNERYERGDRIRVVGKLQFDAVIAEDIDRI